MRALRFAFLTATMLTVPAMAFAGHAVHRTVRHAVHADPGYTVAMDEARVITFDRPVATVFIGNSTIADVTIIDSRHAYLLGKTFGATNLIGLDIDRAQVVNKQITVADRNAGSVTLNRGAETYNYSCTNTRCETDPRPGDPTAFVSNTEDAAAKHVESSLKAAASVAAPGGNP